MTRYRAFHPAWFVVAGIIMLGGALLFQYVGGLQPCVLCIYQRWPWGIAIGLGAIALFTTGRPRLQSGLTVLGGLTMLVGAGIAGFHVGVEQGWWEGTAGCGGSLTTEGSIEDITAQLLAAPVVRCDEIAWSLLGISMAGYNFIISAILAIVALVSAPRLHRQPARA
ncbi:MAG: disulfide bond formation protein B [Pseudomonadota bacterium]